MALSDISIEPLLNRRLKGNVGGPSTNREVALDDTTPVAITPTSGCTEMHLFNNTGVTIRYGGSGVTTATGGKIFNQGSMSLNPSSTFSLYLILESGTESVDIVEFY